MQAAPSTTTAANNLNVLSELPTYAAVLAADFQAVDGAGETLAPPGAGPLSGFQNPPNSLASSLAGGSAQTSGMPSMEGTPEIDEGEL